MARAFNPLDQPESFDDLLGELWIECRPLLYERLAQLEDAVASVLRGQDTPAQRQAGASHAHKLIGALGPFGLQRGSLFALQLEKMFETGTIAERAVQASELVDDIRRMLDGFQPVVAADLATTHRPVSAAPRASDFVADVLVVEDDPSLAAILERALGTRGYGVRVIGDGQQAVATIRDGSLASRLMLLDIDMPGADGFAVLDALQASRAACRAIVVTARATSAETMRALQAGAFEHIAKPFNLDLLLERVRKALD